MKNTQKTKNEEIREKIRKETGFFIKNINKSNAKKELEKFIYFIANSYNKCWLTISYLEEIIDYSSYVKDDRKMKIVQLANNIIDNIFQDEQMDYSDALDGFLKLAISDNTFYKILKTDIPILEKVREMIKTRKEEKFDYNPIYEELTEFYLDYEYDGDINKFFEKLNSALEKIFQNENIMKDCFYIKGGTKDEG